MGKGYLLDTNAVLDYMGGRMTGKANTALARIIDRQINLSVINKIELLGFSKVEQDLVDFVGYADIYPMDEPVVDKTIEIRRIHKIKLPDAVIAATAICHGLTLVTNNTKDFKDILGLDMINPYQM